MDFAFLLIRWIRGGKKRLPMSTSWSIGRDLRRGSTCICEQLPGPSQSRLFSEAGPSFLATVGAREKKFDIEQICYREAGLPFRHIDNINHWLRAMSAY